MEVTVNQTRKQKMFNYLIKINNCGQVTSEFQLLRSKTTITTENPLSSRPKICNREPKVLNRRSNTREKTIQ